MFMSPAKKVSLLSIQEAMDNLAALVQLDLDHPPLLGIINERRLVSDSEAIGAKEIAWISGEGSEVVCEVLDLTFRTIQHHLSELLKSPETNWDDPSVSKGAESLVALCSEATFKLEKYLKIRLGKSLSQKIEERPAYSDLHDFYHNQFVKKIEGGEVSWEKEGSVILRDFDQVRRDVSYELFSICNEDGIPYFNAELLKSIRLVCFDAGTASAEFEEDPLLKVRAMEDRNLQASAQQILQECHTAIHEFFSMSRKSEMGFAKDLSAAVMALYLTANPRNLIQNAAEKSSLSYFQDFHLFLRKAMNSDEYLNFIAYPPEKGDKFPLCLLFLVHSLCHALFYRPGGVKQEVIGILHRTMRKGEKKLPKKGSAIWDQLMIDDEHYRACLNQFPNGPLFKVLDAVRQEDKELGGFDPFLQGNLPQYLYTSDLFKKNISVLKIGCPTRQLLIHKANIVEEFRGFLRANALEKKKHLLINLQDRLSWQESARCHAIEDLQNSAEFRDSLVVVTLAKQSLFYYQNGEYINCSSYEEFIEKFKAQLEYPESSGFFFPMHSLHSLSSWFDEAFAFIHETFFEGSASLRREQREDFLEIFYLLLILKMIELVEPDSMSFTCKDAVDTGSAQLAAFYGLSEILKGTISEPEHLDFLRYLFYAPALFVRERAINSERFTRTLSALQRLDEGFTKGKKKVFSAFKKLYSASLVSKS